MGRIRNRFGDIDWYRTGLMCSHLALSCLNPTACARSSAR
jgi:hypothetical protein